MAATNGGFFTQQFLKPNGQPAAGVRVFHYVAGNTTTNLDVYQNGDLTSPHANPVIGDTVGRVWFYGSGTYRLVVRTAQDDPTHPNLLLYDWDPVEIIHHTATLRAEDRGLSLPAASVAGRGRQFATTNTGGDVVGLWIQRAAAAWQQILTLPTLSQMVEFAKGTTIASSSSITIPGDGNFFDVTGTNSIQSMSGFNGYPIIYLRTLSSLQFTHHATNLRMLGSLSRQTVAGQITSFLHTGAGQWTELWYQNPFFGDGNFIDGGVLVGNGQGAISDLSLPSSPRVLGQLGTSGVDPSWVTGLLYHGPTAMGAGSSLSHSSNLTIGSNQSLAGLICCTNFALNVGATITVPANGRRLVIIASDAITINGSINTTGAGGPGGLGSAQGSPGTDQIGGVGAGFGINWGAQGNVVINGCVLATIGQMTGGTLTMALSPWMAMGGAGGGGAENPSNGELAAGGSGGGSIVLIAPTITLGAGSVLTLNGAPGALGNQGSVGGSGGGAGNFYTICRTLVNNGVNVIQNGGGSFGAIPGGTGQAGVRQHLIYG